MGLVNVLLPKKFNGIEVDFVAYNFISPEIFRGDGGTSVTMAERISPKANHIHGEYAYSSTLLVNGPVLGRKVVKFMQILSKYQKFLIAQIFKLGV